ncbi:MAG: hypothetical protein FWD66_04395 [Paludibacter sp.]|nr:hypothetical protein [Paludibacter sp.]
MSALQNSQSLIGERGNEAVEKFWEGIKHHKMRTIASDYWKPYERIIIPA